MAATIPPSWAAFVAVAALPVQAAEVEEEEAFPVRAPINVGAVTLPVKVGEAIGANIPDAVVAAK